ncbi:MAG: hypothetical protein IPK50_00835 [Fibrobacterota bacterium]|nr:MAG: hypothetical protein IPK50_00835 [Fibrobacterota bacterium]
MGELVPKKMPLFSNHLPLLLALAATNTIHAQTKGYVQNPNVDYKLFPGTSTVVYADHDGCTGAPHNPNLKWNIWTDNVRTTESVDGQRWSGDRIAIEPNRAVKIDSKGETFVFVGDTKNELAACDPEVYLWNGTYYMQYTGASDSGGTIVYIARSSSLNGPWEKYSTDGTWKVNSESPKPILRGSYPADRMLRYYGYAGANCYNGNVGGYYGLGQTSVVVRNGNINVWYSDDRSYPAPSLGTLKFLTSTSPTSLNDAAAKLPTFTRANGTRFDQTYNLLKSPLDTLGYFNGEPVALMAWTFQSMVVRWSSQNNKYYLHLLANQGESPTWLVRWESTDGFTWTNLKFIAKVNATAHNVGITGDASGIINGDIAEVYYSNTMKTTDRDWNIYSLKYSLTTGKLTQSPTLALNVPQFRGSNRVDYPGSYGYAPSIIKQNGKYSMFYCADPGINSATPKP